MTTTVSLTDLHDGASDPLPCAVDPFQGLRHLLPKLARPGWVRLMGKKRVKEKACAPSPAAERAMRRNDRKLSRLQRSLAGEHTRVAKRAAAA